MLLVMAQALTSAGPETRYGPEIQYLRGLLLAARASALSTSPDTTAPTSSMVSPTRIRHRTKRRSATSMPSNGLGESLVRVRLSGPLMAGCRENESTDSARG